jgi:hypothetical protein
LNPALQQSPSTSGKQHIRKEPCQALDILHRVYHLSKTIIRIHDIENIAIGLKFNIWDRLEGVGQYPEEKRDGELEERENAEGGDGYFNPLHFEAMIAILGLLGFMEILCVRV